MVVRVPRIFQSLSVESYGRRDTDSWYCVEEEQALVNLQRAAPWGPEEEPLPGIGRMASGG